MDCASLLHIARLVEHAKRKLNDVGTMASLPSLAVRCVELACRVEQRVQDPALLIFMPRAHFLRSPMFAKEHPSVGSEEIINSWNSRVLGFP